MGTNRRTIGEVDSFINMLLAGCEDAEMNKTLEALLSQPNSKRKVTIRNLILHLKGESAPVELIDAIRCLLDDEAAEKAYEYIYLCKRK